MCSLSTDPELNADSERARRQHAALGLQRDKPEPFRQYAGLALGSRVPVANPCGCVGPQDGQPLCPCQMRGVIVRDGRYVMPERDLGPV